MFRFLVKLGFFLPILLLIVWVNWSVDPAKLFGGHSSDPARYEYELIIARELLAGRPHAAAAPNNERIID